MLDVFFFLFVSSKTLSFAVTVVVDISYAVCTIGFYLLNKKLHSDLFKKAQKIFDIVCFSVLCLNLFVWITWPLIVGCVVESENKHKSHSFGHNFGKQNFLFSLSSPTNLCVQSVEQRWMICRKGKKQQNQYEMLYICLYLYCI